ncbi:hypothetical protein LE191_04125 [Janthinobacterium sp. HSC-3S05]|uniref:hypothetical protein n=1 Tax=Janthinobacterium lividum TaxID=29581 RepID=UPI001CD886B5|nr:hypothetical protein [Janthinobacterium lividum]MCA1859296.1 hypothetical protein [Janthinobacterium lividum]
MIKSADALLKAREEAIERGWVTDGAKADDPTIFVIRPVKAAKKNGYVFTNLQAFVDGYEHLSELKIERARQDVETAVLEAQKRLNYAEGFWGGADGLNWYCSMYGVTEADVLEALKKA